jgi:hypothetical protein
MTHKLATVAIFERLLDVGQRAIATQELADQGEGALPILESLFSGTAKNQWGVPYRQLGTPFDCALVAAARLGSTAIPLEGYLRAAVQSGHPYAAQALAALGTLKDESIAALASQLETDHLLATEAAIALVCTNNTHHSSVKEAIARSAAAATALQWAEKHAQHK